MYQLLPFNLSVQVHQSTVILSCSLEQITPHAIESPPKNPDPDVPSPFRRALIWPERYEGKQQSKRKREKISSVVTSDVWWIG